METLNEWLSLLDKIQGLSAAALVFLSCIVMGYVWRFIHLKWMHNDSIPLFVILWGAFAFSMIADPVKDETPWRVWVLKNVICGAVIGLLAWILHNYAIKRVEDWLVSKLPGLSGTALFNKGNTTNPNP